MTYKDIIELFVRRSEEAVRSAEQKYGSYLKKIAMNILGRHEDSEECVNDTYFTAWRQIPPDEPERLLPYLGRITRCLALDRWDHLNAKKRNSGLEVQLSELEDCLAGTDSVKKQYEAGEIAAAVSAFLKKQSEGARNIFIRRYWYSENISDIAKRFGKTESNIKTLLSRTRSKLKKNLESEGFTV